MFVSRHIFAGKWSFAKEPCKRDLYSILQGSFAKETYNMSHMLRMSHMSHMMSHMSHMMSHMSHDTYTLSNRPNPSFLFPYR